MPLLPPWSPSQGQVEAMRTCAYQWLTQHHGITYSAITLVMEVTIVQITSKQNIITRPTFETTTALRSVSLKRAEDGFQCYFAHESGKQDVSDQLTLVPFGKRLLPIWFQLYP